MTGYGRPDPPRKVLTRKDNAMNYDRPKSPTRLAPRTGTHIHRGREEFEASDISGLA